MDDKWLVELTSDTVTEVDRILRMPSSEFIKDFGTESERVNEAKIDKAQTMIGTLKFFIDKATGRTADEK